MFKDRTEAGKILAKALAGYRKKKPVICALPRGGVVVAYEIAESLKAPLDVVVTRKIGHPENEEFAICSVDEKGSILCDLNAIQSIDQMWLKGEIVLQKNEAVRRVDLYRGKKLAEDLEGRVVILVDDGIATGLTVRLAIELIKKEKPKEIIVAVPVAPLDFIERLRESVDEVVVLESVRGYFGGVGEYYEDFRQVPDREVIRLMRKNFRTFV